MNGRILPEGGEAYVWRGAFLEGMLDDYLTCPLFPLIFYFSGYLYDISNTPVSESYASTSFTK